MRKLMEYVADKGSFVINGVCIRNGVGDGSFDVFLIDKRDETKRSIEVIEKIWFDLRDSDLFIWEHDCHPDKHKTFTSKNLGCDAVLIGLDGKGNIFLIKYF